MSIRDEVAQSIEDVLYRLLPEIVEIDCGYGINDLICDLGPLRLGLIYSERYGKYMKLSYFVTVKKVLWWTKSKRFDLEETIELSQKSLDYWKSFRDGQIAAEKEKTQGRDAERLRKLKDILDSL